MSWRVGWSQPAPSWQGLERLKPGQRITCVSTDGSESSGRLKSVSAGEMTLGNDAGQLVRVAKECVRVVLVRRRPRGNMPLWIGLGAAMGGAVGAGIGALLRGKPEDIVVYRAALEGGR